MITITVSYIDLLNYKAIYALYMHVHTNDVVISQSNSIANNIIYKVIYQLYMHVHTNDEAISQGNSKANNLAIPLLCEMTTSFV